MNVKLYIENRNVELTDEVKFAITSTFEDLSDPATIINDWSKTVDIPFSDENNKLFGGIFAPNRMVAENDGTHDNVELYFDPTKKLDFKLLWNGMLIMNGYAKMNAIKRTEGTGTYELTLNGELGYIFQELKKLACYTEDEITTDPTLADYDLTTEISGTITKDLVYNSWTKERTNDDVIGFACCNDGYNQDFNSSNVQISYDSDTTFEKLLEGRYEMDDHPVTIDPSTLAGDGMLPRSFGEYRSYYQRPFIYVPKMFELLKKKMTDIGLDYELILHPKWFNKNNHYYYNLVMMLNKISDLEETDAVNNTYNSSVSLYKYYGTEGGYDEAVSKKITFAKVTEEEPILSDSTFTITSKSAFSFNSSLRCYLRLSGGGWEKYYYLNEENGLVVTVRLYGANGKSYTASFLVVGDNVDTEKVPQKGYNGVITVSKEGTLVGEDYYWYFDIPLTAFADTAIYGDSVSFYMFANWVYDVSPAKHIETTFDAGYMYVGTVGTSSLSVTCHDKWNRSNAVFDFKYLWDNEHNFFEQIIKYTKLFRLMWILDEETKTLTIIPADEYFNNNTITDWGYKLDMADDFNITPCTMDSKYISLGYADNDTKLGAQYLTKYGVNYGDCKFYTFYDFNTDTTKLIEDIPTSIVNTSVGLDWDNLYDATCNGDIVHFQNFETKPYFATEDNDSIDAFGSFFFYRGLKNFDTKLRDVYITDDTNYQVGNDEYMYIDPNAQSSLIENCMKQVTTYPWLDVIDTDGHLCLFNKPAVSYDVNNNYSGSNVTTIYSNFWELFLDERYNLQNNKVECSMYLTPVDYVNFAYNHFILIKGRCYMINQISDYDVTENGTTKVELVSIYDMDGYDTVNYEYPNYIVLSSNTIKMSTGSTTSISVKVSDDQAITATLSPTDGWMETKVTKLSEGSYRVDVTDTHVGLVPRSDKHFTLTISNADGTASDTVNVTVLGIQPA